MSILIAIISVVLMVVSHEWGHFIAGRICKVPIYEFSIGMGPALFKKKGKKETTYSLRLLPLGGYCAFDNGDETGVTDSNLNSLPVYKRIFIFIMGPVMNIITAIVLCFFITFLIGMPTATTTIDKIADGFSYENIESGDTIVGINEMPVTSYADLTDAVHKNLNTENIDKPLSLVLLRNGETVTGWIKPQQVGESILIGIAIQQDYVKLPFGEAVIESAKLSWESVAMIFESIGGLITGKYKVSDMSGIVGIVSLMGDYAKPSTAYMFFYFAGIISMNLGIMNLLPIPGLDGSKILFGLIEAIRKKPIPQNIETAITLASFGMLMLLAIVVTIFDISRLIA